MFQPNYQDSRYSNPRWMKRMPKEKQSCQGTVITRTVGNYTVRVDGRNIRSTISSLLWKDLVYPLADPASRRRRVIDVADIKKVSPVAIGDIVELDLEADGSGRIRKILSRKNSLSRKASGPKMLEQVLVANIDLIVPVFALSDRNLSGTCWTGISPSPNLQGSDHSSVSQNQTWHRHRNSRTRLTSMNGSVTVLL